MGANPIVLNAGEIDVLRLIAGGNANKEIAAQLSVPEETVKGRSILAKLGANDRTHAAIGLKRGIIEFQLGNSTPERVAADSLFELLSARETS